MAYYNRNDNRSDTRYGNRNDNRYGGNQGYPQKAAAPQQAQPFPEDYVDFAENLMQKMSKSITTSKLRNILSMLMDVYNVEVLRTEENITRDSEVKLQMARIRIAYECGRDNKTKQLVGEANLLPWLKAVGKSREKAIAYIHYVEALVAYHRFYEGREN